MSRDPKQDEELAIPLEEGRPTPCIKAGWNGGPISDPFNAVSICLRGGPHDLLNWEEAQQLGREAIVQHCSILWDIQLTLFPFLLDSVRYPTHLASTRGALHYFRESLWQEFQEQTVGLNLWHGNSQFASFLPWNESQEEQWKGYSAQVIQQYHAYRLPLPSSSHLRHLFARNLCLKALMLLAEFLPAHLPLYFTLDLSHPSLSLVEELQLREGSGCERFRWIVQGGKLPCEAMGWEQPTPWGYLGHTAQLPSSKQQAQIGICLSDTIIYDAPLLADTLEALMSHSVPFRLIPESLLTAQWEGLDWLFYQPHLITRQGKRALKGFCAAGGKLVSLDPQYSDLNSDLTDYSYAEWHQALSLS